MFVLVASLVLVAAPGSAQLDTPIDAATDQSNPYAGPDGASPMDEVPVVPMIAATASVLVVLSAIAVRREWLL